MTRLGALFFGVLFALAGIARADESLQKQVDDLKAEVEYIKHNYEPAEPVEQIKQVTEWVSPSGELFTETQKGNVSPTDGSPLAERVTYRKMKFARRELVADKIASAIQGAVDGHVVVGLNFVGVYQNLVGAGTVLDNAGQARSANRGAGSGQVDITFSGKPMRDTVVFVDLNSGVGPGIDSLASNSATLNSNYLNGANTPSVREAWFAVHSPAKLVSFQAGLVDLTGTFDANLVANDETAQFLTGSFDNSPILMAPTNGAGAVLRMDGTIFNAKIGAQNAVNSASDATDAVYSIAELGFRYDVFGDSQWRIWGRQRPRGDGQPDQALGVSVDHRATRKLTTFWRYSKSGYVESFTDGGGAVPDSRVALNTYDWAASAGFELGNLSARRLKDHLGFGYGRNVKQAGSYEDFSELYYKTVLTNNFTVSLHGQGVFNRVQNGAATPTDALSNVFALGLRTQISY